MTTKKQFYKTKEFLKLQEKWYKKLASSGFHNLEHQDKNFINAQNSPFFTLSLPKNDHLSDPDTAKYYENARAFTSLGSFPSRLHKYIWELHSEGISYRKMREHIKRRGFKKCPSIFWISKEINKMRLDMARLVYEIEEAEATSQAEEAFKAYKALQRFITSNEGID